MEWCEQCRPYGGRFRIVENPATGIEGAERCDCADSARVADQEARRKNPVALDPVLTEEEVTVLLEMAAGLVQYFPGSGLARSAVGQELRDICASAADGLWLVREIGRRWEEWKGVREMRRLYCSSGRVPLDGLLVDPPPSDGEIYLPPVAAVVPKRLPPGQVPVEIRQIAGPKDLAQVRKPRREP
ncbi:MAG: hypothetical protein K0S19_717 [Geminicoccaceae bacterium]|jgi:hypothetical protein|nr:hypothetical protein [Geminicoccaceae bacterium]